jgi:hypothetical protein
MLSYLEATLILLKMFLFEELIKNLEIIII